MADQSDPKSKTGSTDKLFRKVIVASTVLSLALAYGWLACFKRLPSGNVEFHLRPIALAWVLVGVASSLYFWRKIWPPNDASKATRNEIVAATIVLALPGLWWITFPLHFLSGQRLLDVAIGLTAAAIVLGFGAWMVTRLIKAFERIDTEDLNSLNEGNDGETGKEVNLKK